MFAVVTQQPRDGWSQTLPAFQIRGVFLPGGFFHEGAMTQLAISPLDCYTIWILEKVTL